jgi:hypothetical protein
MVGKSDAHECTSWRIVLIGTGNNTCIDCILHLYHLPVPSCYSWPCLIVCRCLLLSLSDHCQMNNSSPIAISDNEAIKAPPASSRMENDHPVATATLDHFIVKDDGKEYFIIDGRELPARKVKVEDLRKFASRNVIKRSQPPHLSLSRRSRKNDIIDETIRKITRRENGQPDPWLSRLKEVVVHQNATDCSFAEEEKQEEKEKEEAAVESSPSVQENKTLDMECVMKLYSDSQERTLEFHKQMLEIQKQTLEVQKQRAATARAQLRAFQYAARFQAITTWRQESERLSKKRKTLKEEFVDHCKYHPKKEKQDHKARLKGHRARIFSKGSTDSLDSDIESVDSQASLLNELDETNTLLRKAKKGLKDAEEDVVIL